ncbi:hypothetical protein MUN89_03780 [Halobacillus salinarum]|uniref:Uncharacterized protein n=1 Tax=Halobacillus salinarum TaxID=2932257 RepID=A0ABY4EKU0_9BACI|nr:hypothetical protein [Halobacillus salinarum]UOQ45084.1 hypothetical protein MUN89_03780 [Halobacillus salinarum]
MSLFQKKPSSLSERVSEVENKLKQLRSQEVHMKRQLEKAAAPHDFLSEIEIKQYIDQTIQKQTSVLYKKLSSQLNRKLHVIETEVKEIKEKLNSTDCQRNQSPSIYVDQLFLEKFENVNNIEQIGVRDLSGQLNIGTSHNSPRQNED